MVRYRTMIHRPKSGNAERRFVLYNSWFLFELWACRISLIDWGHHEHVTFNGRYVRNE